jgi:hypothetical protein
MALVVEYRLPTRIAETIVAWSGSKVAYNAQRFWLTNSLCLQQVVQCSVIARSKVSNNRGGVYGGSSCHWCPCA